MRRYLAQPEDDRDQQRRQAEGEGDDPESRIVEEDDAEDRKQKNDREQAVGDDSLQAVAKLLERHPRHGQIAGRMAVQDAWRKAHQAVPDGSLDPRCRAPLQPHHRRASKHVQQCADQAKPRQRHGHDIKYSGAPAPRDLARNEPESERRQQLDQAARKPGDRQPRQVGARSVQRDSQQVCRPHGPRRQRPIEHPGFVLKRAGALRRHADTALADRVDFPVAPESSRQQRDGPAVSGAECQQRVAVTPPPVALGLESHAPGAHAGRIENVHEADRSIGRARTLWDPEIDPFMAAHDVQGIRQRRVLGVCIPVDRQVIDIEEALPRDLFGRAAAGRPRAFEIRIVDQGQLAVQAFQSESNRMKGGERRQQTPLLRQRFG